MTDKPLTIITPANPWRLPDLRELWHYRELLLALGLRDVRVRYRQTVLGVAWALIQPLATVALFTLIFGRFAGIPSEGYPYAVFVFAGLLPWMLFSNAVSAASGSLVGASAFITRVWFPRLLIPVASIVGPLVDFAIASVILLGMMIVYGVPPTPRLLAFPLLVILLAALAAAVGTGLSALIVTYRDIRFVIPFVMQFWLFASPVIYPVGLIPERYRWVLEINPMTGLIEAFRWSLLGKPFDPRSIGISIVVTIVGLAFSISYFHRVEERFADVI